jgi:hypothetical protein
MPTARRGHETATWPLRAVAMAPFVFSPCLCASVVKAIEPQRHRDTEFFAGDGTQSRRFLAAPFAKR